MPVYTKENKRILFVHIPRTGGKSIRAMLQASGWEKEEIGSIIEESLVSPVASYEHQPYSSWSKWGEFDFIFTIVRNPYSRLESEARSKSVKRKDFFNWLERQRKKSLDFRKTINDGHFSPQHTYVGGEQIKIFKFEAGHENIARELTKISILNEDVKVLHVVDGFDPSASISPGNKPTKWKTSCNWKNQKALLNKINQLYKKDFETFDYKTK